MQFFSMLALMGAAVALPSSGSSLQPERPQEAASDATVRALSRRRYGGELKRDINLWAEMARRGPATALPQVRGSSQLWAANHSSLPKDFTWSNHNGIDYLNPQRNQHIPRYCGSCWAFASTAVLADRWNVKQKKEDPQNAFYPVALSVQALLSCGNAINNCGTCEGGDDAKVYELAATKGLVHSSCSEYMAMDTLCGDVIGFDKQHGMESRPECYNCDEDNRCWLIQKHKRLWSSQPYSVEGEANIMAEIREHGPIACAIMATDKMEHEYGENCMAPPGPNSVHAAAGAHCITGTFREEPPDSDARINHVVEMVGWGTDQHGNDYWTIRNSWGTEWGDQGFMNIVRDSNNGPLGRGNNLLETQCGAAKVLKYE